MIKGITGGLRSKFNAAVAEVGYQDVWQRATLGVSVISETAFHAEKQLREIEKFISRDDRVEIIDKKVDDHGMLAITSIYVRYLLPMMIEVQWWDYKRDREKV